MDQQQGGSIERHGPGELRGRRTGPDRPEADGPSPLNGDARPTYRLFGREFPKPGSRRARLALGSALTVLGLFGFLPILGLWMIPLGLFILSHELHPLRRLRRRLAVRRARKTRPNGRQGRSHRPAD